MLTYAKIPGEHQKTRRISALEAIFRGRDFREIARDTEGRDALLTYARIPGNTRNQIEALEAVQGRAPGAVNRIAGNIMRNARNLSREYRDRLDILMRVQARNRRV